MSKYFGEFSGYEDVAGWSNGLVKDDEIICADYDTPSYDGYAACYFLRDGKLFEVHDSHCSCYGLENWEPEETTFEAVLHANGLEPEMRVLIESARDELAGIAQR